MSAAALAQRLRTGAVPGLNQAERNGRNTRNTPHCSTQKQAAIEGETPDGTARTGGTDVLTGEGMQGAESGSRRPHPDDVGAPWRPLARAYNLHHFGCPTCRAAGRGNGRRCEAGDALWGAYLMAGNEATTDNHQTRNEP